MISLPPITMFVPGVQTLAVGRLSRPLPPRYWTSIETGNSWSFPMLSGVWPWIMAPLLRIAQLGPPGHCSPTNRYSTRSR